MRLFFFTWFILTCSAAVAQTASWAAPTELFPGSAQPSFISDAGSTVGPLIRSAVHAPNELLVVWSDTGAGITEILGSSLKNGVFSPPVNLSNTPDQESVLPELLTAPGGVTCLAWTEFDPDQASSHIRFKGLLPDGVWTSEWAIEGPSDGFQVFPALAYTDEPNKFIIAYTEIEVDATGDPSAYRLRFLVADVTTGAMQPMDGPSVSPLDFNFRATLLNEDAQHIHCCWYDAADENQPYDSYIAYSAFINGVWTATEALSTDVTITTWDDGPIRMWLDRNLRLSVVWSSFSPLPSQAFIARKNSGLPFENAAFFFNDEVLNWAFAPGADDKMEVAGIRQGGIHHYSFQTGGLQYQTALSNDQNGPASYPDMIRHAGALHLFYEQQGQLMYTTLPLSVSDASDRPAADAMIVLAPNPCGGIVGLTLEALDLPAWITVQDITGKLVFQGHQHETTMMIPSAAWAAGTYLVRIQTAQQQQVRLLFKQ